MFSQRLAAKAFSATKRRLAGEPQAALPMPPLRLEQTSGRNAVQWLFGIHGSHHQQMLGHCAYSLRDLPTLLVFKARKRLTKGDRPFSSQKEWRDLYLRFHEELPAPVPYGWDEPAMLEWLCRESYGVLLLRRSGQTFTLDTSELAPYVRRTDDLLDTTVSFAVQDGRLRLASVRHGEQVFTSFDSASARRALRAASVGTFTIISVRLHALHCHFEVADRYATFAAGNIPHDHPLRRMLSFAEYGALLGSDQAVLTLLDYAFPAFTNLDKPGLHGYLDMGRRAFSLLNYFHLPTVLAQAGLLPAADARQAPVELPVADIALMWWRVLDRYVQDYVDAYYPTEEDIDPATRLWLQRLLGEFGVPMRDGGIREQVVAVGTAIAFAPVIHKLCFNEHSVDLDPFRFGTRLRLGEDGPAGIEYRREALMRASVTASVTLPSILYTSDLTAPALDERGARLLTRLSADAAGLDAAIRQRHPAHRILLPANVECSVRW